MNIKEVFNEIMNNYLNKKITEPFNNKSSMFQLINYNSKEVIQEYIRENDVSLAVRASCGAGVWTRYPWIAVFNTDITNTIQEGVYIVYLFSEDMERVYLTLNQGCTNLKNKLGTKEARAEMKRVREKLRLKYNNNSFNIDNKLKVGNIDYEEGCIFYKEYKKDNIPEEEQLKDDLYNMIRIYKSYYNDFIVNRYIENDFEVIDTDNNNKLVKIKNYINGNGYIYSYEELSNFYLSLKTKPFVILAGISGTGKSKLVRLFAEAINAKFKSIPVKPDWNDSTELLGYKNIKDEFVQGELYKVIDEAKDNLDTSYFVCLDEMNLARVEYYLSEYLSVIESRKFETDRIVTDKLFSESYFENVEGNNISIPENLYIIGTVNMDDTTFAFSRKVLDRANTIEFSEVDLELLDFSKRKEEKLVVDNSLLKTQFLNIEDALKIDRPYVEEINKKIVEINNILKPYSKHFGYRVRDEIVFYMLENKLANLLDEDMAFDYQIMQKILPTIIGSDVYIEEILIKLFEICTGFNLDKKESYIKEAENVVNNDYKKCRYKKSATKILQMLKGYRDGFVSFWQ